jgi:hypothetical protein
MCAYTRSSLSNGYALQRRSWRAGGRTPRRLKILAVCLLCVVSETSMTHAHSAGSLRVTVAAPAAPQVCEPAAGSPVRIFDGPNTLRRLQNGNHACGWQLQRVFMCR